ncbi:restriction endonuclease subunit S [Streptomyces sp. SCSIO 30461]|uniref:restriction endonuclease subunit S n=1 Tax=Streptomyces sp. SCSIO 30461 TaxID=3118085 RepID=UPI0030D1BAC0
MADWRSVKIEDLAAPGKNSLATGPFGSAIGSRFFREEGVPVLRGSNLSLKVGDRLLDDEIVFVDESKADEFPRSVARQGDLVFTCWGTIGQVGLVDNRARFDRYIVSNKQMKLTPDPNLVDSLFLYYCLSSPEALAQVQGMAIGSSVPGFNLTQLRQVEISCPPLADQKAIAEALGVLDDKIAVNERIATTARELGLTFYSQRLHDDDSVEVAVEPLTTALTRGVAPKYTDSSDELTVLNQKCVRGGRVNLDPSRLTLREKVKAHKLLQLNDVLVNSTGVGTLGRVARWTLDLEATVDSHITIVRFNEDKVDPVCAGFAMLRAQPEIEAMGEGSTGQTELRRSQVGELELILPGPAGQKELRPKLDALEERADQALRESLSLAALRDTLLPQLMSGKLRVRDAEKIVEEAV